MIFNRTKVPQLDSKELKEWIENDKNCIILDVRSPGEWAQTGIIPESLMIPNYNIVSEIEAGLKLKQNKPIVVVCRSGRRSKRVAKYLIDQGMEALNLSGGIKQWDRNGYDLEKF